MKTILNTLEDDDRLSLVAYSTDARTVFGLLSLTKENRKLALEEIEKLKPENSTNLWDGLL